VILVDTSVWVDYFNGVGNTYTDRLDSELEQGTVAIGDLIFLEILQGFKRDKDFDTAKKVLQALDHYEIFGHAMALRAAENYRALRQKGIAISKKTDVIITTFCIENQIPLLFSDRGFDPFTQKLGLVSAMEGVLP
jgi:predicted nucleic acid-binding protein